jgi:putative mycofactocin binding protein MftB
MYCLSPGVRARKEGFGLLFYNSKDAKLTFVKSEGLLRIDPGPHGEHLLNTPGGAGAEGKVVRLLDALSRKGLIVELRSDQ